MIIPLQRLLLAEIRRMLRFARESLVRCEMGDSKFTLQRE